MATNENEIGVKAVFDVSEFNKNAQSFDAKIKQLNATTAASFKKLEADITKTENEIAKSAKERAKAQEQAAKAAEKSAKSQEAANKKLVSDFKRGMIEIGIIIAAAVVAYKKIEEQVKRLGDKEIIAGFEAMDTAVQNMSDSLAAMAFEALKIGDIFKFMASGVTALTQVLTLASAGFVYLFKLFENLAKYSTIDFAKMIAAGTLGKTIADAMQSAKQAADKVVIASVQAPAKVKATATAEEDEKKRKEAEDKRLKDIADYNAKIRDLQIKSGESILDAENDFREKSAQNWADYIEKTQDIIAEGIKKRAELQQTYLDAIRDAETTYQRGIENASYQHGKKLADIARDYQDTVNKINQDYGKEALDAARNLDAIAFVRAKEKRDAGLADAAKTRDRANAEEGENYSRQLYELQRALEDKKREAEIAYQRGLDDQKRAEQEQLNSAKSAYRKQQNETEEAFNTRIATIKSQYAREDAEARAHYLSQEAAFITHLQTMQAILARYNIGTGGTTPRPSGAGPQEGYAEGGTFIANGPRTITVGEGRSPELVMVQPINRMIPQSFAQTVQHVGDFRHAIDASISSGVAGLDGRITAAVRKGIAEVLR